MKKNIIIFATLLSAIALIAFSWMSSVETNNQTDSEFNYMIGSRYATTITKENLHKAVSVNDILPKVADWRPYPIHTLKVTIFKGSQEISENGDNLVLNKAQTQLLQSIDYSDGFRLIGKSQGTHKITGEPANDDLTYLITVTPEKEAEYSKGKDALNAYLKENSKIETSGLKPDQVARGKISFTISQEGKITNVEISSTSGISSIDNKMLELINNAPGKWKPAENTKGDKIEQDLVFTFGNGGGC